MNADASPAPPRVNFLYRAFDFFQQETGQSLLPWLVVAVLSFMAQIVFFRELGPGEFGTLNTVLGAVGLFTVPVLALSHAMEHYLAQNRAESLRAARLFLTEIFALGWGALSFVLLLFVIPLLDLPSYSLELFTLLNVFIALGAVVSAAAWQNNLRLWGWLLMASALTRLLLAAVLVGWEPWAEAGLAAILLAGSITLIPALRQRETERDGMKAWQAIQNRDFLLQLSATFSIFLAIFLFSSADRIVAQSWFGRPTDNNMGLVRWDVFDGYQAAGLLGRALIWGTQPLLLIFFMHRSRLDRTTSGSLRFFWIYLGALFGGAILLGLLAQPLGWLFCGSAFRATAHFIPAFALAMVPIGFLQGLAVFALASRRHPECFVLGGASIGYTLLLYLVSRQPQLMLAYMFGAAVLALMLVLFVGVVRWGRKPEQILWNQKGTSR